VDKSCLRQLLLGTPPLQVIVGTLTIRQEVHGVLFLLQKITDCNERVADHRRQSNRYRCLCNSDLTERVDYRATYDTPVPL
jgi:hypothetical protein